MMVLSRPHGDGQALGADLRVEALDGLIDDGPQIGVGVTHGEAPGLQLGKVEQVVGHHRQALRVARDGEQILPLLLVTNVAEFLGEQRRGTCDYRQGVAQLMGDQGTELVLGTGEFHGQFPRRGDVPGIARPGRPGH